MPKIKICLIEDLNNIYYKVVRIFGNYIATFPVNDELYNDKLLK